MLHMCFQIILCSLDSAIDKLHDIELSFIVNGRKKILHVQYITLYTS